MCLGELTQWRRRLAYGLRSRTSRREPAAAGRIDRARHISLQNDALTLALFNWIGGWHSNEDADIEQLFGNLVLR